MKGIYKHRLLIMAIGFAAISPQQALAGWAVSVLDFDNLLVNEAILFSNFAQNVQLEKIREELVDGGDHTVKNYTFNIDNSTKNIDNSTHNIDKSISYNTEIHNDFTWIINKDGEEIIPIPFGDKLGEVMKGQSTEAYTGHYQSLEHHERNPLGKYGDATAAEGSRARKAANDALVEAVAADEAAMNAEVVGVKRLLDLTKTSKGHGRQLQVSNALAGSQINQLMKLRAMMLASETAHAAEAQAAADRDARAVAVGKKLREGLDNAMNQAKVRPATY